MVLVRAFRSSCSSPMMHPSLLKWQGTKRRSTRDTKTCVNGRWLRRPSLRPSLAKRSSHRHKSRQGRLSQGQRRTAHLTSVTVRISVAFHRKMAPREIADSAPVFPNSPTARLAVCSLIASGTTQTAIADSTSVAVRQDLIAQSLRAPSMPVAREALCNHRLPSPCMIRRTIS